MFQEARAKRRNASGTAAEHATGGNATKHAASAADIKDSRGPATDGALSASGAKQRSSLGADVPSSFFQRTAQNAKLATGIARYGPLP